MTATQMPKANHMIPNPVIWSDDVVVTKTKPELRFRHEQSSPGVQ